MEIKSRKRMGSFRIHSAGRRYFSLLASMSFVVLSFLSYFTFQPYYKEEEKAHAEGAPNAVSSELVLDVTSSSADLQFAMLNTAGSFTSSGDSINFVASTNNASGYTIKYAGGDDSGALMHESGEFGFTSISAPLTAGDFSASTSYNNQWGFKPSKYVSGGNAINNTGDSAVFLPIPTTAGVVIDKTESANSNDNDPSAANDYSIEIGARADNNMLGGEYMSELSLTIVANPVSYRITYDAGNAADEVTGLPGVQNSATSDTSITIPAETPTRAHYSFLGWCSALPVATDGVDACVGGTQYAPGDEYGINQTTTNNATLHAMWKIDTFTCTKQYRLENADGGWSDYITDGEETVNYGGSCAYNKSVTDYKSLPTGTNNTQASTAINNVTENVTALLNLYRNTYALTVTAGTNTSSATGSGSYRWGQTATVGVTKAANVTCVSYATPTWIANIGTAPAAGASSTYTMPKSNATVTAASVASNVAQTITFKTVNATSITLNGTAKANNQTMSINCGTYNLSGAIPANYHFTSWGATAGTLGPASTLSTTYQVTGAATITLNAAIDSYNQTTRYRYENVDGTWGGWTTAETVSKNYGSSYSWSTSQISNFNSAAYQAASVTSYTVTGAKTNDVSIYRKTFTCSKQYRLEDASGNFPSSYTADGSVSVRYGGSCSYSKTVTDYRGASNAANGAAGSTSASSITAATTLSLSFYRNTFTLTVAAGANTSGATGGGAKRWGQSVAVGVTKAANVTCTSYGTPTWTATAGTAPAAGASSTYIMPKSNATVTASSAASSVAQTITLSRTGGASGITIAGTSYTGSSVALYCGTYNISGNYSSGYEFSSWGRANGVTVGNAAAASTTMTVSSAGTLTLNGKTSKIYIQDISSSTCPTTNTLVYDKRDEKGYYIRKIGSLCWMTTNLDLAAGTVLNSTTSDVSSSYTVPSTLGSFRATINSGNTSCNGSKPCYSYYSIAAAHAASYASTSYNPYYTSGTLATDSVGSICPKNWRLPTASDIQPIGVASSDYGFVASGMWNGSASVDSGRGPIILLNDYSGYSQDGQHFSGMAALGWYPQEDASYCSTNLTSSCYARPYLQLGTAEAYPVRCVAR